MNCSTPTMRRMCTRAIEPVAARSYAGGSSDGRTEAGPMAGQADRRRLCEDES